MYSPGDTIDVCPGTYNEQLAIGASRGPLTLRGAGAGATVVRPLTVVPNSSSLLLGVVASAIVAIDGASDVAIRALTVDGSAADGGSILFADCRVTPFCIGVFSRGGRHARRGAGHRRAQRVGAHGVPSASAGVVLFNPQPSTEPRLRTRNVFDANQVDIQRQSSAAAV